MIEAVIFDLDGVLVSTDEQHYQAWKRLAREEEIPFDRAVNESLRGISRMASLDIILEKAERQYEPATKKELAQRKNNLYVQLIQRLTPADMLPGAMSNLAELKAAGIRVAVGSSSRNTGEILSRIGLSGYFDAVADGNDITHSKPDPEVFLVAMNRLGQTPEQCLVVEDAEAGVEAALAAGMRVLGVGAAASSKKATHTVASLAHFSILQWIQELDKA